MDDSHGYIYRVFFLMESKVFVNLTYLYILEINKQGLIFSVGLAHLMISNKICEKKYYNIHSISLNTRCHFQKTCSLQTHFETLLHSNADNSQNIWTRKNVIVLFGNGRASALKWCASRIYRIKITDFTGQNVSFFLCGKYVLVCEICNFYQMHT